MRDLFRAMTIDGSRPLVAPTARALGVRVGGDVFPDDAEFVYPEKGGMSVTPDDPLDLPPHRKPPEFGGTGRDPVWKLADDLLPESLRFRADSPSHGLVEPTVKLPLDVYERSLADTCEDWMLHP